MDRKPGHSMEPLVVDAAFITYSGMDIGSYSPMEGYSLKLTIWRGPRF